MIEAFTPDGNLYIPFSTFLLRCALSVPINGGMPANNSNNIIPTDHRSAF